ncbi:hypothetical protein A3A93_05935 [Candidatus Roizmanbacteria bacterium RIFCSPLOWO2_01_FULL_38_12]|uniref:RNase H type-1 domain-containing protein n=1 Tax=Candidatus Roizmanbacteria bacterium RIFCSPLOWO2_01_FULL_38_12 TaxID=1802061 RepID=A0A1F7IVA9_9BACT|nr:MAG: hypothetical protein A2861_02935 [Candidatus Roizmanbacteria bacterium RIFCSPHIGHO2_01_FULL_38_15]OGK36258.1 MAG: hypothetical protein A3F59_00075 [Candidatus Roizmanbacteria bacterium RIFCSPHIGHO2_12_FULL_38_13]OGK47298.1 MAG: hypothetical protein A3A93_05935 [Candidatus Roizmanbacteria bacterium RIFCSPLOWO2_01_FULL_38_12]
MSSKIVVFTDGGSLNNPGKAASAFLIYKDGKLLHKHKERIGIASNNVAEYTALIQALTYVRDKVTSYELRVTSLDVVSDSLLLVSQVNGVYKVKHANIKPLHSQVKMLEMQIGLPILYTHVLREKNQEADALVKEALTSL